MACWGRSCQLICREPQPEDLDLKGTGADAVLRHFEVKVLTQGAGCQIYSTTFVQMGCA
jgi:hypothetical protein